jgi:tetratricopeptide (TPR) repeat protein
MGLIAFEEERFDQSIRLLHQSFPLASEDLKESIVVQLLNAYAKAIAQARREERIGDAIKYYHAVIELLPDNRSVYNDLGNAYVDIGDMDAAMAAYRQAIAVSERYYATAHANIGLLLFKQGAFDEAQTIFEEILIREPNALAASGRCKVLNAKGKIEEALDTCFLAIALAPDTRDFYDLLVEVLLKHHDLENALLLADKKVNQSQDALAIVKGFIHARGGQHMSAIALLKQSGSVLAQLELAQSALAIEEYRLADAVLKKVSENNPELLEAVGPRCIALGQIGDIENALPLCKIAALHEPKNSRYQITYGDLLTARNSTDEALQFYHQALENGANEVRPKLAAVYNRLGATAEQNGVTGDAIKLYQKAIALNPQATEHHNSLGRMLLKQRRYEEALAAFNTTIQMDATFALAYANKGQAAYALGEMEEALAAYKRALEINNALPQALEGYCALLKATGGTMDEVCQRVGNL